METTLLIEVGLGLFSLLLANYGMKLKRVYPLLMKIFDLMKNQHEARKDGKLTTKEKAKLYDDIEVTLQEVYIVVVGFFPNKSKKTL